MIAPQPVCPNTTIIFFIRDALSKVEYIQRIIQEAGFEQKVFLCYKKDVTASTTTWGPFVNKMYSVAKRLGLIK